MSSSLRWIVLWACFALAACASQEGAARDPQVARADRTSAPGAGQDKGHSRALTPGEQGLMRQLMEETERVRGLPFLRPVPVLVQDSAAIIAHVEEQIEEEALADAQQVYTALGLLPPGMDVKALFLAVLREQVLGYYDPEKERLVVRNDIMRQMGKRGLAAPQDNLGEARLALVHELVHALQSQHLSLAQNMEAERDIDAENAFRGLIEGDATLAMIGFLLRQQQPNWDLRQLTSNPSWVSSLASLVESMPLAGSELGKAPDIIRIPLLYAYMDGMAFAADLHGKGGWSALNHAHARPPLSTEQVLHPKYFAEGSPPESVRIPKVPALAEAGYELADEDTLGELEIGVYFGQALDRERARQAAAGWGGDRLHMYRDQQGQTPIVWLTLWDDEKEAREAEEAAVLVLQKAEPERRTLFCVVRRGRAVLIVRHLPADLQPPVVEALMPWKGN